MKERSEETTDSSARRSSVCYVAVECATLGTNFRDIEKDGDLWAREVPTELAESFVSNDWQFGNVKADIAKLRTWVMEWEFKNLVQPMREEAT